MSSYRSRDGGILLGLLMTAVLVVCLAVAAGIFVARNVTIDTRTKNDGHYVSIETPAGHLSVRAHDRAGRATADVPLYPGARIAKDSGGDAVVEWTSNNDAEPGAKSNGFSLSASETVTPDRLDKVLGYYRAQLPNWMIVTESDGTVRLELHEGGYKRIVAIHERSDGTHIGVASVGEPESN